MRKKVFVSCLFLSLLLAPVSVLAKKSFSDKFGQLDIAAKQTGVTQTDNISVPISYWILQALKTVGIVFFGLMIYAGFRWMLARGNEEYITKARRTMIAASIGLLIIVGSYALTKAIVVSLIENAGPPISESSNGGTQGQDNEPLGCCIAATTKGTYGMTLTTEALCSQSQVSNYPGKFYPQVTDNKTCTKIFDCWDEMNGPGGNEEDKNSCLSELGL